MEIKILNKNSIEIESFYRVSSEYLNWKNNKKIVSLVKEFAGLKKEFLDWYKQYKTENSISSVIPFFSKVIFYELEKEKDFMNFTREEIENIVIALAKDNFINTKSQFYAYTNVIMYYTMFGYTHNPRLRNDVIKTNDYSFTFKDIVKKEILENNILTFKEMDTIISLLKYDRNELVLRLAVEGFTLKEILNIKRKDVFNIVDNIIKSINRGVKISHKTLSLLEFVNSKTVMERKFRNNRVKVMPLRDTPYVIRLIDNGRAKSQEVVEVSTISRYLSEDLIYNAGYTGTFKDFRLSAMLNDYLVNKYSFGQINNKYNIHITSKSLFEAIYTTELTLLNKKLSSVNL